MTDIRQSGSPGASYNYTEDWQTNGAMYRRMLDVADSIIRRVVADGFPTLKPIITREHSDAPEISLQWQSPDNINRIIHVYTIRNENAPSELKFAYSIQVYASQDDFAAGTRRWSAMGYTTGYSPVALRAEQLQDAITHAIDDAMRINIESLLFASDLPPLPAGLSAEQRERLIRSSSFPGKGATG